MAKRIGETLPKTYKSQTGTFFFGFLIGIIFIIALFGGVGAFAYYNISPKWLNEKFNAGIETPSDEIDEMTLSVAIPKILSFAQNIDNYTLNDLQSDFGIQIADTFKGIDISDLKNACISDIATKMSEKFQNISIDELKEVVDMSKLDSMANKKIKYYLEDNSLYKDEAKTQLVGFAYSIDEVSEKITINKSEFTIVDSSYIEVQVRYLPITQAFSDYFETLGANLTIKELKDDFGVNLPEMFSSIDENTKINNLSDQINDIYLADIMEYTIENGDVKNNGKKVEGIAKVLAKKKVSELNDLNSLLEDVYLYEVLGYTLNVETLYDGDDEVEGLSAIFAKKKLSDLSNIESIIEELTVADLFGNAESGIFSIIEHGTLLSGLSGAISASISEKTLYDLEGAGLIEVPDGVLNKKLSGDTKKLGEYTILGLIENLPLKD